MCEYSDDADCVEQPPIQNWTLTAPYPDYTDVAMYDCQCDWKNGWIYDEDFDDGRCVNCNTVHPDCASCDYV